MPVIFESSSIVPMLDKHFRRASNLQNHMLTGSTRWLLGTEDCQVNISYCPFSESWKISYKVGSVWLPMRSNYRQAYVPFPQYFDSPAMLHELWSLYAWELFVASVDAARGTSSVYTAQQRHMFIKAAHASGETLFPDLGDPTLHVLPLRRVTCDWGGRDRHFYFVHPQRVPIKPSLLLYCISHSTPQTLWSFLSRSVDDVAALGSRNESSELGASFTYVDNAVFSSLGVPSSVLFGE